MVGRGRGSRLSFILVLPSVRGLAALTVFNGDLQAYVASVQCPCGTADVAMGI